MVKWSYDLATGMFISGGPFEPIYNPAAQGVALLPDNPSPKTQRFDTGTGQVRPATAQEIADWEASQIDGQIRRAFDGNKDVLAFAMWTAQKLNIPLATARAEILAIRRTL